MAQSELATRIIVKILDEHNIGYSCNHNYNPETYKNIHTPLGMINIFEEIDGKSSHVVSVKTKSIHKLDKLGLLLTGGTIKYW